MPVENGTDKTIDKGITGSTGGGYTSKGEITEFLKQDGMGMSLTSSQ